MTITTIDPVEGDLSTVPFGVEHEYNLIGGCDCGECDEFYGHDAGSAPDLSLPPGWGSHYEHCGYEVKTGVETDIAEVMEHFSRIEDLFSPYGPNPHDDCGLHVHLNANPAVGPAIDPIRFFQNYMAVAEQIRDLAPYADERALAGHYSHFFSPSTTVEEWLGYDRMSECAAAALQSHGTVEVRLAAGTNDMNTLETFLRALLGIARDSQYTDEPLAVMAPYADERGRNRFAAVYRVRPYLMHCGYDRSQIATAVSAITERVA